jgi:tetratricopeptide (TPR) repeat protein
MKDTSVLTLPIQRLQAATAKNPKSPLLVQLADVYVQQGKAAEVIEMLKASRDDFKGCYSYHVVLAKAYTAEKKFADARTALVCALSLAPDSEAVREALIGLPLSPDASIDVPTPNDDVAVAMVAVPPPPPPSPMASTPGVTGSGGLNIDINKIATAVDRIRTAHPDLVAKTAASASSPNPIAPPPLASLPVPPIQGKPPLTPPVQTPQAIPEPDETSVNDAFERANQGLYNMDDADIAALLGMADPPPPPPKPTPRPPEPTEEPASDSLFLSARSFHLDEGNDDIAAELGITDPILPSPKPKVPQSKSFEEELNDQSNSLFADEPKEESQGALDSLFADEPPAAPQSVDSPSAVTPPPPPKAKADDSLLFADEPELPSFADNLDTLPLPSSPAMPPPQENQPLSSETGSLKIDLNKLRQVSLNIQKQTGVATNAPTPPKPAPLSKPPAESLGRNTEKPRETVQGMQLKPPPATPPKKAIDPLDALFDDGPAPPPPATSDAKSKLLSGDDMVADNFDIDALARELMNAKMPPMTETNDATPMAEQLKPVEDMGIQVPTLQLAEVFIEQGLFVKAIEVYEALSRKEPEHAEAYGDIILQLKAML